MERAVSSQTKEERNIYKCYKSIKKDYRDVKVESVIVKQSLCIMLLQRWNVQEKRVNIVYFESEHVEVESTNQRRVNLRCRHSGAWL